MNEQKLCKLWSTANGKDTESEWCYVAGWIDGVGDMLVGSAIEETGEDMVFLHRLALMRGLAAWAWELEG